MRLAATAALLLALAVSGGEVPVPDLPGTGCGTCLGKAWLPCPHAWKPKGDGTPDRRALDVGPLQVGGFFCSACLDLSCCHGLGWVPCATCAPPEAEARRKVQLQERDDWLARRREAVDRRLGSAPLHVRTDHYELVFSLNFRQLEITVDAKTGAYRDGFNAEEMPRLGIHKRLIRGVSPHLQAHLYARRLEECWEQFAKTFDPDGKRPIWPTVACERLEGYTPLRGERVKREKVDWTLIPAGTEIREQIFLLKGGALDGLVENGKPQKVYRPLAGSFFFDILGAKGGSSENFQTDGAYHHYLYHNVAGLLVHDYAISGEEYNQARSRSQGDWRTPALDLPDWIHEGWSRVQEMDRFGEAQVHCNTEVVNQDFRPGKRGYYLSQLKNEVAKGKALPLGDIGRLHLDKFNSLVHMEIWYVLDFLRRRDPTRFPELISRIKCLSAELSDDKEGFARALEEVYGLTPLGLDEAWKAALLKEKGGE